MGVNSLPKTVTRQRRDCDLNPGPTAPELSTLTTRLSSHHCTVRPVNYHCCCVDAVCTGSDETDTRPSSPNEPVDSYNDSLIPDNVSYNGDATAAAADTGGTSRQRCCVHNSENPVCLRRRFDIFVEARDRRRQCH